MGFLRPAAAAAAAAVVGVALFVGTSHRTEYAVGTGAVAAGAVSGEVAAPAGADDRVRWALGQVGVHDDGDVVPWADGWSGYCEAFAVAAVDVGAGQTGPLDKADVFASARDHYEWALDHGLVSTGGVPPAGALVFYDAGVDSGHVAVSVGGGTVATTQGEPGDDYPVAITSYTSLPGYLGWSWY